MHVLLRLVRAKCKIFDLMMIFSNYTEINIENYTKPRDAGLISALSIKSVHFSEFFFCQRIALAEIDDLLKVKVANKRSPELIPNTRISFIE